MNCEDAIDRLLKMAKETDYVNIAPLLNYYHHDSKTGNEIEMPYDDISAQQIADIIAATKWKKQKAVRPKPIHLGIAKREIDIFKQVFQNG